jgi:hypothetical protein
MRSVLHRFITGSYNIGAPSAMPTVRGRDRMFVAASIQDAGQEVLVNGGFEDALGTGWVFTGCGITDGTGLSPLTARTGSRFLRGLQSATCSAVQTVAVSNPTVLKLAAYMNNYYANNSDRSRVTVEAFSSGSWSTVYDSGAVTGTSNTWYPYTSFIYPPANTSSVRISLLGVRSNGTDLDAYWDDISLRVMY